MQHRNRCSMLFAVLFVVFLLAMADTALAGDKYGFTDKQGNMVIEPQWDYAEDFPDEGPTRVFKGKLSSYGSPEEGLYGLVGSDGTIVSEPQWTDMRDFSQGLARVQKDGKYGYIDMQGNLVIQPQWDYTSSFTEDGIACVFQGTLNLYGSPDKGIYGYVRKDGVLVSDLQWNDALDFSQGLASVQKQGKYGYIDIQGNMVIQPEWDYAESFVDEGFARVFKGTLTEYGYADKGKYGFIRKDGTYLSELQWSNAYDFSCGLASVQSKGKYGFIDEQGKTVIKPQWDHTYGFDEQGIARVFNGTMTTYGWPDEGIYGFIHKDGTYLSKMQWEAAENFSHGLAAVKKDGKYGFIDTQGEMNIQPQWDYANAFDTGSAYARVFDGELSYGYPGKGVYGYIRKDGTLLGEFEWEDAVAFSDGLAGVKKGGLWGYIDETGQLAIEPQYADFSFFKQGLAVAQVPGNDFKEATWGMTKENIIAFEGTPDGDGKMDTVDAAYIYYERTLCGLDALLAYYFCDDGLFEARYIMKEEHSNESLFIDDYATIRSALQEKYGYPDLDNENWDTTDHKLYYLGKKGDALNYGYLTYFTLFTTDRTDVQMDMSADNYEVSTTISFSSNDIKPNKKQSTDF